MINQEKAQAETLESVLSLLHEWSKTWNNGHGWYDPEVVLINFHKDLLDELNGLRVTLGQEPISYKSWRGNGPEPKLHRD